MCESVSLLISSMSAPRILHSGADPGGGVMGGRWPPLKLQRKTFLIMVKQFSLRSSMYAQETPDHRARRCNYTTTHKRKGRAPISSNKRRSVQSAAFNRGRLCVMVRPSFEETWYAVFTSIVSGNSKIELFSGHFEKGLIMHQNQSQKASKLKFFTPLAAMRSAQMGPINISTLVAKRLK